MNILFSIYNIHISGRINNQRISFTFLSIVRIRYDVPDDTMSNVRIPIFIIDYRIRFCSIIIFMEK